MTKTQILRGLQIEFDKSVGLYMVCYRDGLFYRAFGCAVSQKAAKSLRADVRRNPDEYSKSF